MQEEWLTIQEACKLLKVSDQTLLRLRKAGKIKSIYPHGKPEPGSSGMVRIPLSSILKLMEEQEA